MTEAGSSEGGAGHAHGDDHGESMGKPLVLPETFDGTQDWGEWCFHFENVAAVNGWDAAQKLKWLRVRLTGRAQKALLRLPESSQVDYEATRKGLKARFEPESRQTRYQAQFQTRRKRAGESWADLADDLRTLADRAYPTLQDEARERLSINAYLQQLSHAQVAFSVKQKQPKTLDEAVAATLEMESYLVGGSTGTVSTLESNEECGVRSVGTIDRVEELTRVVERLAGQVERLQQRTPWSNVQPEYRRRRVFRGECWKCHQPGHMARNCPEQQGN